MVRCGTCRQSFTLDGDAADILAARVAAGGAIRCLAEDCAGLCLPV